MREILFRGKRIDNGEWAYGLFVRNYLTQDDCCIVDFGNFRMGLYGAVQIIPETVGQYTCLVDKNGNKIFEGDIVKMSFEGTDRAYNDEIFGSFDETDFDGHKIGVITLSGHGTFLKASYGELYVDGEKVDWKPARKSRIAAYRSEVIGNIHDTPELLKGGDS